MKRLLEIRFVVYLIAAVFIVAMMSDCSPAKGTDLEPRKEILQTLKGDGYIFARQLISTVYGDNQNQVIVSGRLARRTPDSSVVANGYKVAQYTKIVVENENGVWKIVSATKRRG